MVCLSPPVLPDAQAITARLDIARAACAERGAQLTEQRREILELLLLRGGYAKAYDLQEDMQARHGRVAPTTVYRALEFLMEQRQVHKVDATNTYVVCSDALHQHGSMMIVCTECGRITEWHDHALFAHISAAVSEFVPQFESRAMEIKGVCGQCRADK